MSPPDGRAPCAHNSVRRSTLDPAAKGKDKMASSGRMSFVPLLLFPLFAAACAGTQTMNGSAPAGAASIGRAIPIPLEPGRWTATDSIRFERHLGRPAMFINRGVALAEGVELRDGTYEFSMAATDRSTFLGAAFHAARADFTEVIFFRFGQSGTTEAVQYGPALNNLGAAWQVYHGAGANATAVLPRERWIPVRLVFAGGKGTLYLDGRDEPTLVVPRLAGTDGTRLGVWTGLFGRGAWFSDFAYTPAAAPAPTVPAAALAPGDIATWEISQALDATRLTPGTLPDLASLEWQPVRAEPDGIVLLNRYREAPTVFVPFDPDTRHIRVDSVMGGRVTGTRTVFARTFIDADREEYRRMHFGYSDAVVIYANGQPLFFGMNAQFFRGDGIMSRAGDAVYLPLRPGRNEIVLAVTEYTGGWGFWARLDP